MLLIAAVILGEELYETGVVLLVLKAPASAWRLIGLGSVESLGALELTSVRQRVQKMDLLRDLAFQY